MNLYHLSVETFQGCTQQFTLAFTAHISNVELISSVLHLISRNSYLVCSLRLELMTFWILVFWQNKIRNIGQSACTVFIIELITIWINRNTIVCCLATKNANACFLNTNAFFKLSCYIYKLKARRKSRYVVFDVIIICFQCDLLPWCFSHTLTITSPIMTPAIHGNADVIKSIILVK